MKDKSDVTSVVDKIGFIGNMNMNKFILNITSYLHKNILENSTMNIEECLSTIRSPCNKKCSQLPAALAHELYLALSIIL